MESLPSWWNDFCSGDFASFDDWLKQHGLDAETVSGLPPFADLDAGKLQKAGSVPVPVMEEEKVDRLKKEGDLCAEEFEEVGEGKPGSHYHVGAPGNGEEPTWDSGVGSGGSCEPSKTESPSRARVEERPQNYRAEGVLSEEVQACLKSFPKDQFLGITSWPPTEPGYLGFVFWGERGRKECLSSKLSLVFVFRY